MKVEIMPHLFLVKINKEEQKVFKEKLSKNSPFFMPISNTFNSRNMECGEIVQIGERMRGTSRWNGWVSEDERHGIYGWEKCEVGMTLIFHHSIESPVSSKQKDIKQYFLYEDEGYNYYAVDYVNVRGFYDGKTITPHPNFVFLKNIPAFPNLDAIDEHTGNKIKKSEGGIFLVTGWHDSPQDIAQRSQKIKDRIESLTKSKRTPEIQIALEKLEEERNQLNRKAQKHEFLPYRLAFSNRKIDRDCGIKLVEDDVLYCYNKACLYISNFQLKEYTYIICMAEHIGAIKLNDK